MKLLFLLAFVSTQVFASGKLSLREYQDFPETEREIDLGLGVYEKLPKLYRHLHYTSWTGSAYFPGSGDYKWLKTKQSLGLNFGNLAFGLGVNWVYVPKDYKHNFGFDGSMSYLLWE